MNLGELLTLLREGILNDRTDRTSGSSDYLWTDQTLVTYINEAQRRFARKGFILRDGTNDEVTRIVLKEGQTVYPLHPSVLSVVSAKAELQDADLTRVGHNLFAAYRAPSENWTDPSTYQNLNPGPAVAYSTDEALNDIDGDTFEQISLRVYPKPRADETGKVIRLRVMREPIEDFQLNQLSASPEIPRAHHLEMLDWAAYLALRIVDDDAGAARRAEEFRQTFEDHVKTARNLTMRKLFAPQGWAFGRGGFAWGS